MKEIYKITKIISLYAQSKTIFIMENIFSVIFIDTKYFGALLNYHYNFI